MITLTNKAHERVSHLAERDGRPQMLRLGVKRSGCSGWGHTVEFANEPKADDEVFEHEGVMILCQRDHLQYLDGMALDYESNLIKRGFRFENPNAKQLCSCGQSFGVK